MLKGAQWLRLLCSSAARLGSRARQRTGRAQRACPGQPAATRAGGHDSRRGRAREDAGLTPGLAPALAELGGALARLAAALDAVAFRDLWRAVAVAATRLLFNEVATEARFSRSVRPARGPRPAPTRSPARAHGGRRLRRRRACYAMRSRA